MKRIFSANNSAEANMIVHVLVEHGIKAFVQGEHMQQSLGQTIDIWIEREEDESEAKSIISEMNSVQPGQHKPKRKEKGSFAPGFIRGLITGILLTFTGLMVYQRFQPSSAMPSQWDTNGDGRRDVWAEYSNDQLLKYAYDRNFDGIADSWEHYDPPGEISRYEEDVNFDGNTDYWAYYDKGIAHTYKSDNDHDGRIDEWGTIEHGSMKERYWSFNNDSIADKKAEYKDGRRVRELYDRNRDGTFDEIIMLDEFERVITVQ